MGEGEQDGQQQDQADREPSGQADGQREGHDAPLDAIGAEDPRHSRSQHFRAAGLGQELAQHGPQGDDSGCSCQSGSQPVSEGFQHPENGVGGGLAVDGGKHLAGGIACRNIEQQHRPQAHDQ